MGEDPLHLLGPEPFLALQIERNARVDGAAARTHHQALEGREAHGCVHGAALGDSGERAAVAQVTGDQPERVEGPVQ